MSATAPSTNSAPAPASPRRLGVIHPQTVHFDQPLAMCCGQTLPSLDVVYETYGSLNADKSNAILICHALSGDAHVAGFRPGEDPSAPNAKPSGWWDSSNFVGPGRPIDTDKYFVICSNILGGCKGTTGPSSIDPATNQPYGLNFPLTTIADMVEVQRRLIDHLGIQRLLCVLGGSLGGMQALEWAVRYPDRVAGCIPLATTTSLTAQSLAFDAVGRNAILSDPNFLNGDYFVAGVSPADGLSTARMLGHITYLSQESMHQRFGRTLRNADRYAYSFKSEFSVETYLDHQGDKFVERFDANSYLYITKAMDYFDLGEGRGGADAALASTAAKFLVISFRSDWLFSPAQSRRIVAALTRAAKPVSYIDIDWPYGHDSFLLDCPPLDRVVRGFLARLTAEIDHSAYAAPQLDPGLNGERLDLKRIEQLIEPGQAVLDLGCGDGSLLARLKADGCRRLLGVELDQEEVVRCIERGVDVIQTDLSHPLTFLPDNAFDTVVLSRTIQTLAHPKVAMDEMRRIARRTIVSFSNFGYWRNRLQMMFTGRTPVSRNLPFTWLETPNLHHLTLQDFEDWCRQQGLTIERRLAIDYESEHEILYWPHLRATDAIYLLSRR